MEVVIPPRRDKHGKRFGFVRFHDVRKPEVFAEELDKIIIGAKKINVNLPRFQREWVEVKKNPRGQLHLNEKKPKVQMVWRRKEERPTVITRRHQNNATAGKSNQPYGDPVIPRVVYHRKNNISEVCFNVPEEEMQKFNKMYVGVVNIPGSTYSVQEWLSMQGVFSVKVTPMGANKVLMEEMEEGIISALVSDASEWIHQKFDDIRLWSPAEADNERVVWVRCHGVPIHAWNEEFFACLARKFGDFLGVDEATRKKTSMDIARIRIRTRSYYVFNMVVTVNINGSLFNVKIVEEWVGPLQWVCLSNGEEDEGGTASINSEAEEDSEEDFGGGPPLFTAELGGGFGDTDFTEEEEESLVGNNDDVESEEVSIVQETFDSSEENNNGCGRKNNDVVVERELPMDTGNSNSHTYDNVVGEENEAPNIVSGGPKKKEKVIRGRRNIRSR